MILSGLPARFKLLPIVLLGLILLYTYFYLYDVNKFDQPLWDQATEQGTPAVAQAGADKPAETVSPVQDATNKHVPEENSQAAPHYKHVEDAAPNYDKHEDLKLSDVAQAGGSKGASNTKPKENLKNQPTKPDRPTKADSPTKVDQLTKGEDTKDGKKKVWKPIDEFKPPDDPYDSKPANSFPNPYASPDSASSSSTKTGPKKGSVVMVTASTGNSGFLGIPNLKEMVYENRKSYAVRHGYEFMWANFTSYSLPDGAPLYWNKIPILQEAFLRYPDAEWLWWMDMDMIIMNHSLSMWDHVLSPEGMARNVVLDKMLKQPGGADSGYHTPASYKYEDVYFMISSGGWGMNVGNFLIRRSHWADWLLDLWIEPLYIEQKWTFPENDGWTHMYRHHPIVRAHTVCTNQRALNAYPAYNSLGEHWQEGDHTIHFAGCGGNAKCPTEWKKYWELKEPYDVPAAIKQELTAGKAKIENIQKGEGLPKSNELKRVL